MNLNVALAVLVHEARRADYEPEHLGESDAGIAALRDLLALDHAHATALLAEGREKARHLTSFYAPVTVIKREYSMDQRIRLVEHLWRVAFADRLLNAYDSMLARNRARAQRVTAT